ncbi:hypothetical protein EVC30_116 [Rhizobium phage RHph_Y1_11]|nr:hypothetical protein EVC30_116 [Rhizobium phage RHph_Y1_11]
MAKMHELLAVEADLNKTSAKMIEEAKVTFEKKADHFQGHVRSVNYFDAERSGENTEDRKALVTTVDDKLGYALGHFGRYVDAVLQKEKTNQQANADLEVGGTVIGPGLPSVFLLGLEQKLSDLRNVILAIPTLNPAIVWTAAPDQGAGIYVSSPQEQLKTEKKQKHVIVVPPTDKFPAQVDKITEDVNVAKITTLHQSGMWTSARKAKVLDNLDALLQATKKARMRANLAEVQDGHIADNLIQYLLS